MLIFKKICVHILFFGKLTIIVGVIVTALPCRLQNDESPPNSITAENNFNESNKELSKILSNNNSNNNNHNPIIDNNNSINQFKKLAMDLANNIDESNYVNLNSLTAKYKLMSSEMARSNVVEIETSVIDANNTAVVDHGTNKKLPAKNDNDIITNKVANNFHLQISNTVENNVKNQKILSVANQKNMNKSNTNSCCSKNNNETISNNNSNDASNHDDSMAIATINGIDYNQNGLPSVDGDAPANKINEQSNENPIHQQIYVIHGNTLLPNENGNIRELTPKIDSSIKGKRT